MTDHDDPFDARLDAALRRRFAAPALEPLAAAVAARAARGALVRRTVAAAAAVLTLAAGFGGWFALLRRDETDSGAALRWTAAYAHALAEGFEGGGCCESRTGLREQCLEAFASALDLSPSAAVEVCGKYCGPSLGSCAGVLVKAGGEPVCVFVCLRERDPAPDPKEFAGLKLHRREVGAFAVYELSRLSEARVLPHLIAP